MPHGATDEPRANSDQNRPFPSPVASRRADTAATNEPTTTTTMEQSNAQETNNAEDTTQHSIEELVRRVVICDDRPIENLPHIAPPELKIIGRCVTFVGETVTSGGVSKELHYEGLVGTMNNDTVMLINVYRYTEEDFQIHRLERVPAPQSSEGKKGDAAAEGNGNDTNNNTAEVTPTVLPIQPSPSPQEPAQSGPHAEQQMGMDGDAANSISAPVSCFFANAHEDGISLGREESDVGGAAARTRNRLAQYPDTTGPIPYMTFMRNHIHKVEFAHDPQSRFYSLFQDPAKNFFDMQCLRMFVRRYIVHTSQQNNPRNVPLRTFVTCRCNCPDLDDALLRRVTYEEIGHLIKVDRDMKRAQRRKERLRRNGVLNYQAPRGFFRHTGILYLTGLPRQTLSVALFEFLMMVILVVYYGVSLSAAEQNILRGYLFLRVPYLCACAVFTLAASLAAGMHSLRLSVPLTRYLGLVILRLVMTSCGFATSLMMVIVMAHSCRRESVRSYVTYKISRQRMCAFFSNNGCSGFDDSCLGNSSSPFCNCPQIDSADQDTYTCGDLIMGEIERMFAPSICFAIVLMILCGIDHYLHYKTFYLCRLLMQTS